MPDERMQPIKYYSSHFYIYRATYMTPNKNDKIKQIVSPSNVSNSKYKKFKIQNTNYGEFCFCCLIAYRECCCWRFEEEERQ